MILSSVDESNPPVTSLKPRSNPCPQAESHSDTSDQVCTLKTQQTADVNTPCDTRPALYSQLQRGGSH